MHPKDDIFRVMRLETAHHQRGKRDEADGLAARITTMLIGAHGRRRRALRQVRDMCIADADQAGEYATAEMFWSRPLWAQTALLLDMARVLELDDIPDGTLSWDQAADLAERIEDAVRTLKAKQIPH